jgi:hypothetical protein
VELLAFNAKYPPHEQRRVSANADEDRQLGPSDGVNVFTSPPAVGPPGDPDKSDNRHLWVFRPADAPYVLETAPLVAPRLASGVAKHTNLTGGTTASCGGELWIDEANQNRLYVNGASGRYGPTTRQQLEDAIDVFQSFGFEVVSFGWNDETQTPYTVLFR